MLNKIKIKNFKKFQNFEMEFGNSVNIIVGGNEAGKSTIVEAIYLCMQGFFKGGYIQNNLSEYMFNKECVREYIDSLGTKNKKELPEIIIELFFNDDVENISVLKGSNNIDKKDSYGVQLSIHFDEDYQKEYEALLEEGAIENLPIEYYKVSRVSFAKENITNRSIPCNSLLVDASQQTNKNGSDMYITNIIKEKLEDKQKVAIAQAHREMKKHFSENHAVKSINDEIQQLAPKKNITVSVDLNTQHSWSNTMMTYVDEIPFHYVGKGEQNIIKTILAMQEKASIKPNILLIEEPESHLSHSKLNELIRCVENENKQVILTSHNSFVANKLGLEKIILLNDRKCHRLNQLSEDTYNFFKKLPGYDVLRMILSDKVILVEGDCEELILQKYIKVVYGKTAMELGMDIMSCRGLSFKRYLEIAELVNINVSVITDNDGNIENNIAKKYEDYLGENKKDNIGIYYGEVILANHDFGVAEENDFNYNTLEPNLLKINDLSLINSILSQTLANKQEMLTYMNKNKTKVALSIVESSEILEYPKYIKDAVSALLGEPDV